MHIAPYDLVFPQNPAKNHVGGCPVHRKHDATAGSYLTSKEAISDRELTPAIDYIYNFLSKPNTQLGRSGDVCPFTQKAMALDAIFFKKFSQQVSSSTDLVNVVNEMKYFFQGIKISNDDLKCVLVIFTNLDPTKFKYINEIQAERKIDFVEEGLMLGQFHPDCEEAGLWSEDFRPLQSPVPMLAVRHMAKTDIAFLIHNEKYLSAYRKKFGDAGEASISSFIKRFNISKK